MIWMIVKEGWIFDQEKHLKQIWEINNSLCKYTFLQVDILLASPKLAFSKEKRLQDRLFMAIKSIKVTKIQLVVDIGSRIHTEIRMRPICIGLFKSRVEIEANRAITLMNNQGVIKNKLIIILSHQIITIQLIDVSTRIDC